MCNCGCSCCDDILKSTATTAVSGTVLLISPTQTLTPDNEQRVKIKITNGTPTAGAAYPVNITLAGANVPVYDKFGNQVYGNDLYNGLVIAGYYGNNGAGASAHYQLIRLPRRVYVP